jgi:choice-of-anchor B domain-containing protein
MKKTAVFFLAFMALVISGYTQVSWNMTFHDTWQATHPNPSYNDCWGYVDSSGREYAIIGSNKSTHFLDITVSDTIVHIATFDGRNQNTAWRDFKVWNQYAFGVSDGGGGSLQIFDLQYLPDSVIKIYDEDTLGHSTHSLQMWGSNLYMIDNKGVGQTGSYRFPVRVVDVSDPYLPKTIGGLFNGSYNAAHDAYVYKDTVYLSVYFNVTNDGLHIFDFTNPANPVNLGSLTSYPESGINHSSWGTADRNTLVMADETHGKALKTVDISDPSNLSVKALFRSFPGALAHNPFVVDTLVYVAYYHDGVQVWSIKDPLNPFYVGYYDTEPTLGGGGNYSGYEGAWGVYPFFPSGNIIASDINNGLFTLNLDPYSPPPPVGLENGEEKNRLSVFPNPSKGNITLSLEGTDEKVIRVSLLEASGKMVYSGQVDGKFGRYDFDFSNLPKGIYLLRVQGSDFEKGKKFILE